MREDSRFGVTLEYSGTITLDLTVHFFSTKNECAGINYRQWRGIVNTNFCRYKLVLVNFNVT